MEGWSSHQRLVFTPDGGWRAGRGPLGGQPGLILARREGARTVGNTSRLETTSADLVNGLMIPGQWAKPASRMPPSQVDPLPTFQ